MSISADARFDRHGELRAVRPPLWLGKVTRYVLVVAVGMLAGSFGLPSAAATQDANPFFTARFTATANPFTFGQDPSWTADGRVLSNEKDSNGISQIYVSRLNGSHISCLTCGEPGPNGFPQERPEGDWILFCSFRGQKVTFGAPCLGGIGSDLYTMRPDGSHVTRLTGPGSSFESGGDALRQLPPLLVA